MILCVDIGNTNIVLKFYESNDSSVIRVNTYKNKTEDEYFQIFSSVFSVKESAKMIVISSVVPEINNYVKGALVKLFKGEVIFLGAGLKTGLMIKTISPSEVGTDLVASSVAAITKYPLPVVIADLGTATKFLVVNEHKALEGVAICAGLKVSYNALIANASKLFEVELSKTVKPYGKDTVESLKSGAIYGHASLVEGMIQRIVKLNSKKTTVLITGGNSGYIKNVMEGEYIFDDLLVLDGIYQIYKINYEK